MNKRTCRNWSSWLILASVGGLVAPAHAAPTTYLASRQIMIEYQASTTTDVTAELWLSIDQGRTWRIVPSITVSDGSLRYFADNDGRHDLFLVLTNNAGASSDAPGPGTEPIATVIVDTVPPLVQIHDVEFETDSEGVRHTLITASLIEENLSPTGLRIFYRSSTDEWADGGIAEYVSGFISWPTPADLGPLIDLRVVATDLAGNSAVSERLGLAVPPDQMGEPTPPPDEDSDTPAPVETETMAPIEPVTIAPVVPPTMDPVVITPDQPQPPAATAETAPVGRTDVQQLRDLATRFMSQGRFSLAAARLQDALELTPDDPDLLVDLGSALYRLRRYSEADKKFHAAAEILPEHISAVEGLALVAATEKRYPEAREHLQHLLRLLPDSSQYWLRYGDIEHRLGNSTQAMDAWQRVLKLPEADDELREKARRRLECFRPAPTGESP